MLLDFGYSRETTVEEEGDFSRRGAILDIFPATFECPLRIELDNNKINRIFSFNPENGKFIWEHQMVIVLPKKGFRQTRLLEFSEDIPLHKFLNIKDGDYVVHNQHGIGIYKGIKKIEREKEFKDHVVIEYANSEKLYVPIENMHLVQKYVAFAGSTGRGRKPKLSRLGSGEWKRIKDKVKKGISKVVWELITIQATRDSLEGFSFSKDIDWQKKFESSFQFKETPDQIKATETVKKDMESNRPMDRLVCGDVGYGKTEVAMRAVFKAVMDNKQVAILVPTTILAEQHYQNFLSRTEEFPIRVEMLSRFRTKSEQKHIIKDIAAGKVDIVVGTHRLLSDDIKFKDLGLLIIDEEQRFGVKAKERIKKIRVLVDVLTLTATPIPRTLYMSLMGARDVSLIATPPQNRIPVLTHVCEFDEDLISQAIKRELNRKGQIYFVHNRVEDIEKIKTKITRLLPADIRVAVGHGQMNPNALEKIMLSFLKGDIDCLVCTTIIESGIDVPNANTLFVNNAHDFGLADLHQLRGRVGRYNRKAYAYFLVPKRVRINEDAEKRLQAISEYSELGSGFKIAFEDLEIRGAGNLLGTQQHGYISTIGFDLYCRMLRECVGNLQLKRGVE